MQSDSDSRAVTHRLNGLGILLLVVGVAGFGGLRVGKARIKAVAQWPSVSGQIVKSEVSTATVKTGRVTRTQPIAETRYSYSVEGKTYESEFRRVVPMLQMKAEGTPEEIVSRYPVGRNVEVYYNPRDPRDALLIPVAGQDAAQSHPRAVVCGACRRARRFADHRDCLDQTVVRACAAAELALLPQPVVLPPQVAAPVVAPIIARRPTVAAPKPTAPARPRTTHWLVRGFATLLGLLLMFFGSLLCVTAAGSNSPKVDATTEVVCLAILLGTTLFGAFLIYIGMRRPSRKAVGAT